ncbi:MAG: hypothetical protein KF805_07255 [Phycisphaeraceae bacterium]|nr:hypothetical protein [Phycisphaeraceae bacterium]
MNSLLSRLSPAAVSVAGLCLSGLTIASNAVAQVATADLAERPRPPVPKAPEQLMGGHGVFMILIGLILLGLVVGACLIPVKRGHMD